MKISDEEVKAAIDAWFGNDDYARGYFSKDMRRAIKDALKVRKRLKRERETARELSS